FDGIAVPGQAGVEGTLGVVESLTFTRRDSTTPSVPSTPAWPGAAIPSNKEALTQLPRPASAPGRWRALALLSAAELGALSLWFSASAVLPALSREWALGDGGRAGLTIAVQAGFILGTLGAALANLPDIVSPRALMGWSALAGAALNAA